MRKKKAVLSTLTGRSTAGSTAAELAIELYAPVGFDSTRNLLQRKFPPALSSLLDQATARAQRQPDDERHANIKRELEELIFEDDEVRE
jgi:hypothetical protein